MSDAAIGCFALRRHSGTRSERHTRPMAAEHSFGSCSGRVFLRGTQTGRDDLRSGRIFCLRGTQTVRGRVLVVTGCCRIHGQICLIPYASD